jgi:hypothetical protein
VDLRGFEDEDEAVGDGPQTPPPRRRCLPRGLRDFSNYFEEMVKEFGYGYVGVPSNLAGYFECLSDRGISRRVYEK